MPKIPEDRWSRDPTFFEEQIRNKLGTEDPRTGWNTVEQGLYKSMRSKDGRLFCAAHNPTAGGAELPHRNNRRDVLRTPQTLRQLKRCAVGVPTLRADVRTAVLGPNETISAED